MRRRAMFEKGRNFRVDDNQVQELNLEPGRGAAIGEYSHPESSEYSDSYYVPGREARHSVRNHDGLSRGVARELRHVHSRNHMSANRFGSGELRNGRPSWADFGASSIYAGRGIIDGEDHRGRGPKGYRRSDERIREILSEHLTEDPSIDASEIQVTVKDCEVTLEGFVSDRRAKWWAEELAHRSRGVKEVHNRLKIRNQ